MNEDETGLTLEDWEYISVLVAADVRTNRELEWPISLELSERVMLKVQTRIGELLDHDDP